MVIVMKPNATKNDIKNIEEILRNLVWAFIYQPVQNGLLLELSVTSGL